MVILIDHCDKSPTRFDANGYKVEDRGHFVSADKKCNKYAKVYNRCATSISSKRILFNSDRIWKKLSRIFCSNKAFIFGMNHFQLTSRRILLTEKHLWANSSNSYS